MTLKDESPRMEGVHTHTTGEEWSAITNSSSKNEPAGPKQEWRFDHRMSSNIPGPRLDASSNPPPVLSQNAMGTGGHAQTAREPLEMTEIVEMQNNSTLILQRKKW